MIDEFLTLFSIKLPICVVLPPGAAHKSKFTNNLNKKISDIFLSYEIYQIPKTKWWGSGLSAWPHNTDGKFWRNPFWNPTVLLSSKMSPIPGQSNSGSIMFIANPLEQKTFRNVILLTFWYIASLEPSKFW